MTIQQAVQDTLAADPAVVRIEPRAELQIGKIAPIREYLEGYWPYPQPTRDELPPVVTTELCVCCDVQVATKGLMCHSCDECHEIETAPLQHDIKRLKELLGRCKTHLVRGATWYQRDEVDELIRAIEAEIGGDDDTH